MRTGESSGESADDSPAPRWALCSDCNLVGAQTCLDASPCWAPLTIADLWERTPNDQFR